MKSLVPFLLALALSAALLAAATEATPSPTKKRASSAGAKAKNTNDSEPATKRSATPAPAKKKKAPVDADDVTPKPAKKKTVPAKPDSTESTQNKKTDDETPPPPTTPAPAPKSERAPVASLAPADLTEFSAQPERVQTLLAAGLALTQQNLTYTYGSADPARGGMDCSGTIYYVLRAQGFTDVPRDSSSQYLWARKAGKFFSVVSTQAEGPEFSDLQPGDLMFWTGTYQTGREVPISHVMLYLGREKKNGQRVMFGASDGRTYAGLQRWGVSVFDFKMPKADPNNPEKRVDFVGYARIPGLRESAPEKSVPAPEAEASKAPAPPATPKPAAKLSRKSG